MPRAKQISAGRSSRNRFIRSLATAYDADRQATAERLAVGDHVGPHPKVFLRPARRETKADETLHRRSARCSASLQTSRSCCSQRCTPRGQSRATRTVDQRRIARCVLIRMQRLQRIHQHAGDVRAGAQHPQAVVVHILQAYRFRVPAPGCRHPAARRPTSHDRPRRSAPGASAVCDSAPAAPPASPLRCRTCETTLRQARRSRSAGARCRPRPDDRRRAPGPALAHARQPRSMHSL